MKLLFLAGSGPHSHSYGDGFLFDGLATVYGYDSVLDLPANPTFHLQRDKATGELLRDDCGLDSDLDWPVRQIYPAMDELTAIVLCVLDASAWRLCREFPKLPVIAVDGSDEVRDRRAEYEHVAGRPLMAYCKRELPLGETWGHPFPLSYPARRVGTLPPKEPIIFYHATDHNGGAPGLPRRKIVEYLRANVPAENLDVELYRGQEKGSRPSPEAYHKRMARASVGISWNGAANWDCNRFWENLAYGLVQVCEAPRIRLPGKDAFYNLRDHPDRSGICEIVKSPDEIGPFAEHRLKFPSDLGERGRQWFLKYGSSEARAKQLVEIIMGSI